MHPGGGSDGHVMRGIMGSVTRSCKMSSNGPKLRDACRSFWGATGMWSQNLLVLCEP